MKVTTTDPRDGRPHPTDLTETDEAGVAAIAGQASRTAQWLFDLGRAGEWTALTGHILMNIKLIY